MNLTELPLGAVAAVRDVRGKGAFRRRLMELGIVPGTRVEVRGIAPLGDPMELLVRGASLSIRRSEASSVVVEAELPNEAANAAGRVSESRIVAPGCARGVR